jgi:hypothetical protein
MEPESPRKKIRRTGVYGVSARDRDVDQIDTLNRYLQTRPRTTRVAAVGTELPDPATALAHGDKWDAVILLLRQRQAETLEEMLQITSLAERARTRHGV